MNYFSYTDIELDIEDNPEVHKAIYSKILLDSACIKELEEEVERLSSDVDYYNTLYNNLLDHYEKLEKKYIDSKYEIII